MAVDDQVDLRLVLSERPSREFQQGLRVEPAAEHGDVERSQDRRYS